MGHRIKKLDLSRLIPSNKEQCIDSAWKKDNFSKRHVRYSSRVLVELRRYRWLPFRVCSAMLLDISVQGFKIEFTRDFKATVGEKYWLNIPLAPLGFMVPGKLSCQTQVRWYDEQNQRIGGVFLNLNQGHMLIIDQIIQTLKNQQARNK